MRIRFAWGVAVAVAVAGCGGSSGLSLSAFETAYAAVWPSHAQLGADLGHRDPDGAQPDERGAQVG